MFPGVLIATLSTPIPSHVGYDRTRMVRRDTEISSPVIVRLGLLGTFAVFNLRRIKKGGKSRKDEEAPTNEGLFRALKREHESPGGH